TALSPPIFFDDYPLSSFRAFAFLFRAFASPVLSLLLSLPVRYTRPLPKTSLKPTSFPLNSLLSYSPFSSLYLYLSL
ncbi:hypothetical protein, partial [Aggregatibacter actinomycetemcomitans]|uniref:hypothetical protein n=1 Tax=Aggregatibacter actinomycetemcomitans TaxID=714 RepID=UPI001E51275A